MSIVLDGTGTISGVVAGGLPDATITQAEIASGVAGTGPAFSAYMGTNQTVTHGTATKLQFNTEAFDTNSNYDPTTNYRFTPTVAGYYQIIVSSTLARNDATVRIISNIHKNGSFYIAGSTAAGSGAVFPSAEASTILYMNGSTDYVEGYVYIDIGSGTATIIADSSFRSQFSGALVRAA